jgi:hypothetical protein
MVNGELFNWGIVNMKSHAPALTIHEFTIHQLTIVHIPTPRSILCLRCCRLFSYRQLSGARSGKY